MRRHARFLYQPVMPLGKNGRLITGCKAHMQLSKQAAIEGNVLLKNDGVLPLAFGSKICTFGRGIGEFLFGGGGSGRVYSNTHISLDDSLCKMAECGEIELFLPLIQYYKEAIDKENREKEALLDEEYALWQQTNPRHMPIVPKQLYDEAKAFGDVALVCISRYSTEGTIYGDRSGGKGDFSLWDEEEQLIDQLCRDFKKVIVILNVCGPVSTIEYKRNPHINALLYCLFGGSMAGEAITDILFGKAYPSGHLQTTLANTIEDYPSTDSYRESPEYVNYREDIFVGYRYFETFCPEKVAYPFGYGLSYTSFAIVTSKVNIVNSVVSLDICVKNTGSFPGREVVQAYLSAPQGMLGKPHKVLCAFKKTNEILPGEETSIRLTFSIRDFGSFDDLGKIKKSAFVLEAGKYRIYVGNNVRDCAEAYSFVLQEPIICKQCHCFMSPRLLADRLTAFGTYEKLPKTSRTNHNPIGYVPIETYSNNPFDLETAIKENKLDEFLLTLSNDELAQLLYGHPIMNASNTNGIGLFPGERREKKKIPLVPTADGPSGLRLNIDSGRKTTHFPCPNAISQSWNLSLIKKVSVAGAKEVKENNIGIWLTPALNIQRSPMCGRNFEYYSEDPLVSGVFAATCVRAIQSQHIAATVKHYCCNNKEYNRKESDSRISERALREIYLRGFEIAIKRGKPWCVMTAYNLVNGERSSTNWEAINGILRGEWGYDGLVMSDWWASSLLEDEIYAGSDVKMPEIMSPQMGKLGVVPNINLAEAITRGAFDIDVVRQSVKRILAFMARLE